MGFGVVRAEVDGGVVALDRGLKLLQCVERDAAVAVGLGKVRPEADGLLETGDRSRILLQRMQGEAAVDKRLREILAQCQRAVEVGDGGLKLSERMVCDAAAVAGVGEIGREGEGAVEAGNGFPMLAERVQGVAALGVERSQVRLAEDGLVEELERHGMLPGPVRHQAQQIERVHVAGRKLEDSAIKCFRLRQLAGAMMRDGLLQEGVRGKRGGSGRLRRGSRRMGAMLVHRP